MWGSPSFVRRSPKKWELSGRQPNICRMRPWWSLFKSIICKKCSNLQYMYAIKVKTIKQFTSSIVMEHLKNYYKLNVDSITIQLVKIYWFLHIPVIYKCWHVQTLVQRMTCLKSWHLPYHIPRINHFVNEFSGKYVPVQENLPIVN